jgi:hypothetical protein
MNKNMAQAKPMVFDCAKPDLAIIETALAKAIAEVK